MKVKPAINTLIGFWMSSKICLTKSAKYVQFLHEIDFIIFQGAKELMIAKVKAAKLVGSYFKL